MGSASLRIVRLALAVLLIGLTFGCERDLSPPLISVLEVAPREAEVGDRFAITGAGFPEGKGARVTFRGTLRRPGSAPIEGAVVEARGTALGRDAVEVLYTEALEAEFCGHGERASHTTFEGEVEVSFAAVVKGAPPVSASVRDVVLDLRPPPAPPSVVRERNAEGARVLAALGIVPKELAGTGRGLVVEGVTPGSSAEEAGVLADDLLVAFDGVRVASPADAIPAHGARTVSVALRRGATGREETRVLRADAIAHAVPTELFGAALVLVLLAASILLFFAPSPRPVLFLEKLLAATREPAPDGTRASRQRRRVAAAFVAVVALLPLAPYVATTELDIPVAFVVLATPMIALSLLAGGAASGRPASWWRSLLRRIGGALRTFALELPVGFAFAAAIGDAGSFRVRDVVAAQGGWPWEFVAFRSPGHLLLFALFLASAAVPRFPFPAGKAPRSFVLAEHLHLVLLSGMAAAVFLGGWTLPILPPGAQKSSLAYEVLGSAVYLGKVALVIAGLSRAKGVLARVAAFEATSFVLKGMIPLAALALVASLAWASARLHPDWQHFVGIADAALFALVLGRLLVRARLYRSAAAGDARLNPFL